MSDSVQPAAGQEAGGATRERLLEAAERLFADKGYLATSVRDITEAAGANLAAINYHFGGKENLYRELFVRRLENLSDQRIAAIRRVLDEEGGRATPGSIIRAFAEAFLLPLSEGETGRRWVQLLTREFVERHMPAEVLCTRYLDPVSDALREALRTVTPGLEDREALACVHSVVAQLVHVIHGARFYGTLAERTVVGFSFDEIVDHIARFSAAGVRARAEVERS
jgi:TetR/AcrR family transcriptional regulator, regulator of cefoperazone and chloramphenicol sensitivity